MGVLAERIGNLSVTRLNDCHYGIRIEELLGDNGVHPVHKCPKVIGDDEIRSILKELFYRPRNAAHAIFRELPPAHSGEIRILLGARERDLPFEDPGIEDEPRMFVSRFHDMGQSGHRVEAWEKRRWQAAPPSVEPERRRAG